MKKNLEVSIILPTLNEEANLKFLIPEIIMHLPNNISNYEIIIVDDNSTDDTVKLVKNLIKGNNKIILGKIDSFHFFKTESSSSFSF